jgi:cbb3-type cytochrome oxidase subunit 3
MMMKLFIFVMLFIGVLNIAYWYRSRKDINSKNNVPYKVDSLFMKDRD